MKRFVRNHPVAIVAVALVLALGGLLFGVWCWESSVHAPNPRLDGKKYVVTTLARVDGIYGYDPTGYDVVKLDGIDVLYLKIHDMGGNHMVPWLKPDGTSMTYDEYVERSRWPNE